MANRTYKFTPYVLNRAGDWQYIEGGEWFETSLRRGFNGLSPVAGNGSTVKVVALNDDEEEVSSQTYEVRNGKMVRV